MGPKISEEDVVFVHHTTTNQFSVVRGASLLNRPSTPRHDPEHHDYKRRHRSSRYSRDGSRAGPDDCSSSIDIGNFHYPSKYKDIVCRCWDPSHDKYRSVHNFEIRALCAEYFQRNPDKTLCYREEWRATFESLFVSKRPESTTPRRPQSTSSKRPETHAIKSQDCRHSDHIDFDRESLFRFLQDLDLEDRSSRSRRRRRRSSASSRKTRRSTRPLRNGPNGELDVPEKVWREARPSVYAERRGLDSAVSTPLGETAAFDFPVDEYGFARDAAWVPAPLNPARRSTRSAPTSVHARHGANREIFARPAIYNGGSATRPSPIVQTSWDIPSVSEFEAALSTERNSPTSYNRVNELDGTSLSELPGAEAAAELPATQRRVLAYHSHTLRELGG
jgi:hypothetical protein